MLLSCCTTLQYILNVERCIKHEFILYISPYYLHCIQLLLRPLCMYLHIICTVLNCFFGLTVCIFLLFALCSTASSVSLYVSSYYLHCAQLLLPSHCMYLRIICTVLNCFFGLTVCILVTVLNCFFGLIAYPTEKRVVIY